MSDLDSSARIRLPGGFNMPPFGIHQYLALVIVAVALWASGGIWLALQGASQWVGSWQQQIELHVYVQPGQGTDIAALSKELVEIEGVRDVQQVSSEEATAWMQQWLGDTGLDADMLISTLPLTLTLTLDDQQGEFSLQDIWDSVDRFGASLNEEELKLLRVRDVLEQVQMLVWFATLVLAMAMALIVSNTLRMILLARADEVHLMRLLGAQEWFVRMPFILEGIVLGGGAGGFSWVMLWPLVLAAESWLASSAVDLHMWGLLLPLLAGGAVVGCLGAVVATARLGGPELSEE